MSLLRAPYVVVAADDRRKKADEGSGSAKRDFGGAGMGAREVKTKGKDKKRLKWSEFLDIVWRSSVTTSESVGRRIPAGVVEIATLFG